MTPVPRVKFRSENLDLETESSPEGIRRGPYARLIFPRNSWNEIPSANVEPIKGAVERTRNERINRDIDSVLQTS